MHFLKNFLVNWSSLISRTLPTTSLFRNVRPRITSYVLPLLILAKSCYAYSLLSKLTNNILLLAYKLLFLSLLSSQSALMPMPWTWHASSLLLKKKNTAALKAYTFTVVNLNTEPFPLLLSQLMNMLELFKTFKTLQLPSLPQKLFRT